MNVLYSYILAGLAIVSLVVLVALHDVSAVVAVPLIAALSGVHSGAALVTNATGGNTDG